MTISRERVWQERSGREAEALARRGEQLGSKLMTEFC
jgi:hypothetical protein